MAFSLSSKPIIIAATASMVIFGVGGYVYREEHRPHILEIYVFNLSNSIAMFIRTPDDYRVLINGGPNSDVIRELTKIIPFYSRRIDAMIATNTDGKNVGGLIDVFDRYHIDQVYIPAVTVQSLGLASSSDEIYVTFLDRIKRARVAVHEMEAGNTVLLGRDVNLKVHFPIVPAERAASATSTTNSMLTNSAATAMLKIKSFAYSRASGPEVLFTINYKDNAVTFMGDASHKIQDYLATSSSNLQSVDALIVSHSALPANMSINFLNKLEPKYLIYAKNPAKSDQPSINPATSIQPAKNSNSSAILKSQLKRNSKTNSTVPIDPLASVPFERRLNIRILGTTHLISDGTKLIIK